MIFRTGVCTGTERKCAIPFFYNGIMKRLQGELRHSNSMKIKLEFFFFGEKRFRRVKVL